MVCDILSVAMFNFYFQNSFPWNLKIAKPVFNDFAEFVNNRVTKPSLDPRRTQSLLSLRKYLIVSKNQPK